MAYCAHYREHNDHVLVRELMALHDDRYAALKRDRSGLDFDDLELVARDLLRATRACASSTATASRT